MDVEFPCPFFAEEGVLVESFCEGQPIKEFIYGEHSDAVKSTIADAGVQVSLLMVFKQ